MGTNAQLPKKPCKPRAGEHDWAFRNRELELTHAGEACGLEREAQAEVDACAGVEPVSHVQAHRHDRRRDEDARTDARVPSRSREVRACAVCRPGVGEYRDACTRYTQRRCERHPELGGPRRETVTHAEPETEPTERRRAAEESLLEDRQRVR